MGLFRIKPVGSVWAYKTYAIRSPHRPATCEQVDCDAYLHGWVTVVAADSEQAYYIRTQSGRSFIEERGEGGLATFTFAPGQQCFGASRHSLPAVGAEAFGERDGDWRGNPTGRVIRHSPQGWTDSFGEHQERLKTLHERG